jgi:tRNA A-37 threonylcarbamoyl transferase component Bud32
MSNSNPKIPQSPQLYISSKNYPRQTNIQESIASKLAIFKRHGSFTSKPNTSAALSKSDVNDRRKYLFLQTDSGGKGEANYKSESFCQKNLNSWRGTTETQFSAQTKKDGNRDSDLHLSLATQNFADTNHQIYQKYKICLPFKSPHPLKSRPSEARFVTPFKHVKKETVKYGIPNTSLEQYIFKQSQKLDQRQDLNVKMRKIEKNFASSHQDFIKKKNMLLKNFEVKFHDLNSSIDQNDYLKNPKPVTTSKGTIDNSTNYSNKRKSMSVSRKVGLDNCAFTTNANIFSKKNTNIYSSAIIETENKASNEIEFNKAFKILNIIDKDKTLNTNKKVISKKIKDLSKTIQLSYMSAHVNRGLQTEDRVMTEVYQFHKTLGKGSYGEVKLITHIKTKEEFAVKIYPRKYLTDSTKRENIENEIRILSSIDNPNIIKFHKSVEGNKFIYIITDYAGSSSLQQILANGSVRSLPEANAAPFIFKIAHAIDYLHTKGIIHRDIKLHNILVHKDSLKLIDFGFAIKNQDDDLLKVFCGTPSYMSPEILQKKPYKGKPCDMWALGICVFRIIFGEFPFRGIVISNI